MSRIIDDNWRNFITTLPHKSLPYSKKNWGNINHSLCSYQGKLKPAIAHHLVKTFVPEGGRLFDPFSGIGTIPFEGALNGIYSIGMDISPLAYYVASAKMQKCSEDECLRIIKIIDDYIKHCDIPSEYLQENTSFGFNKKLSDYYHPVTFKEILAARIYFQDNKPETVEQMMVMACLLHILHGNRPYALSRKSHPIVPYAPSGDFEYKNLIEKLTEKVRKSVNEIYPDGFVNGKMFLSDSTKKWDDEIDNLNAIITSPPFYDSTRFYLANWIRLWFVGWNAKDFKNEPANYVDEKQKKDFGIYDTIFEQAKERLIRGGYLVMHLGKSKKCDMGIVLKQRARNWFTHVQLFNESVDECYNFGISDLGTVTSHEYLIMH